MHKLFDKFSAVVKKTLPNRYINLSPLLYRKSQSLQRLFDKQHRCFVVDIILPKDTSRLSQKSKLKSQFIYFQNMSSSSSSSSASAPSSSSSNQPHKLTFVSKTKERLDGRHLVDCRTEEYHQLLHVKIGDLRSLVTPLIDISSDIGSISSSNSSSSNSMSNSDSNSGDSSINVEVFESEKSHFRMRANFTVIKDGPETEGGQYFAMYPEGDRRPHEVKNFPRGTLLMNSLMEQLLDAIKPHRVLHFRLFEVRFLTTKRGESVIVLIYHIALVDDEWKAAANILSKSLNATIVGRCRGKMLVTDCPNGEIITETLSINGRNFTYFQTEGAFSQPNAGVCEKMIEWALDVTAGSHEHDLLELYCGGGTFTAPLSQNFRKVLATEVSKPSVQLANRCFAANDVKNIKVARLSSEEFTDAFVTNKKYNRLQDAGVQLSDYSLKTVFVDPPRAGLDDGTCKLISRFEKIVYISCNPQTLARDLQKLVITHKIARYAGFDQFPYTHHLEAGVLLIKREVPLAAMITGGDIAAAMALGVTSSSSSVADADEGDGETCLGKRKLDEAP